MEDSSIEILERTIGFEGADATNKTRFSIMATRMLRAKGVDAIYISLPFERSVSGGILVNESRLSPRLPDQSRTVLFTANRLELLHPLKKWLREDENRFAVFDRTKWSGMAYALAAGEEDVDWLMDLERFVPDVELGLLFERPLEESQEIMKKRESFRESDVGEIKKELDQDLALQRRVRKAYQEIILERDNWRTVDVSGIANSTSKFERWEKEKFADIWRFIANQYGNEWLIDPETMQEVRMGPVTADDARLLEIKRTNDSLEEFWPRVIGERGF